MTRATSSRDGDGWGDVGIPVAIAANPGSESQWNGEPERVRGARKFLLERESERRVHVRTALEQARLQVPERRAHFVEHGRAILSHLARQPEQLDLGLERLLDQSYRVRRSALTGEQTVGDAGLAAKQCAAR